MLAGGVFLCVSVLSYWLVGRILEPVADITKAANAIAGGDYQHRIYVASRDELGSMASTLNRMSQALDTRMTQLTESHERQATVLGGMIEGVIAVDQRQRIVFANAAAGRLFNFRPVAAEGRRLLEVVRNHELDAAVNAAVTTRQPQRLETVRDGADKLSVAIQATPLAGNPCPGVVLVMHDTTELRRLESLRRDFVANVSHELKTPLSSIKAYAETLRNGALGDRETAVKFVERIQEQTDRLHNLIIDMLSLARIESAQEVFNIESVAVREVVEACLVAQRPAAEAKQIELRADADDCAVQRAGGPRGAARDSRQPGGQRDQVHRRWRPRGDRLAGERERSGDCGGRHWHRDQRGRFVAGVRAVLSRGQGAVARNGWHRFGAGDCEALGAIVWRRSFGTK